VERVLFQDLKLSMKPSDMEILYNKFLSKCNFVNKTVCFIHSCNINNNTKLNKLIDSIKINCFDIFDYIVVVNIGPLITDPNLLGNPKIIIINHSLKSDLFEIPTLKLIHYFSNKHKDIKLLYLHTKTEWYQNVNDWIEYMLHFNVTNSMKCIDLLNQYDTVGVNYKNTPFPHYSGNFWWATTNYISRLDINRLHDKMSSEWFILSNNDVNKCVQHNTNIDHFIQPYKQPYNKLTIGFHSNQLGERGTEVAMYDYAHYNETIYGNRSVIFYQKNNTNNNMKIIEKFSSRFSVYAYEDFMEIDSIVERENIKFFYNITYGNKNDKLVTKCPNLIHAVFAVEPYGDKYATVSKYLSDKHNNIAPYVPHMINMPRHNDNMRSILNIPDNAFVFGRYGAWELFDIMVAHDAIKQILDIDSNMYFIFANTEPFYNHPRIIYMDKITDMYEKTRFINTCNAMIHAGSLGETFGIAIGEFSTLNKPVVTTVSNVNDSHIEILGDKGILYTDMNSLMEIFINIREIVSAREDWNAYNDYTPEKIMNKFMNVFGILL